VCAWGSPADGDVPVPGDYDGDRKTDLCVFRPANGTWFIRESSTSGLTSQVFAWGTSSDLLVPADYDGDGRTDAAVYRPSTGTWHFRRSRWSGEWSVVFGVPGDVPIFTIR
jgi:spore coat protein A, manganese oxidase